MRDLFESLVHHVASLSQDDFDALLDARPDVAGMLFDDVPDGCEAQADAYSIAEALADPDGVAEAMLRLTRPEVQVLMALSAVAEEVGGGDGVGSRFGGPGFDALMCRGGAQIGRVEVLRLLSSYCAALETDPRAAREALCSQVPRVGRAGAGDVFDRALGRLTDACLVWRETADGPMRLHDVVPDLLPEPGPEWDVFDPVPPVPEAARRLPVERVDAEAQAAATAALEGAERLLRQVAKEPVPLLKAGGVGAREVKRLVRACGLEEQTIRFWLHVAECADLVACREGKLWATPGYDEWIAAEPDQRYAVLFASWMAVPTSVLGPFAPVDQSGKAPAALSDAAFDGVGQDVRAAVLSLTTRCGAGAVADLDSLAEALLWRLPLLLAPDDDECDCDACRSAVVTDQTPAKSVSAAAVATVLAEGTLIGALALGASTPVVRAALDNTRTDASDAVADIASALAVTLPPATHRVRVQGDMTVVAAGLPSAKLTAFFDAAAERESAGAATVWRVTDSSVRRWLDAGRSAEELLLGFTELCEDELPQALRYLIEDAARRYGLVDVITARAVVVAADAALGAELAVLPALTRLGVRRLSETVLVLDAAPGEVLGVLRFAGYLPSAHNADGSPTVAVVAAPRASAELELRPSWV